MSRRRFLGAALVAPVAAVVPAVAAPSPDAELLALCAAADELLNAWNATYDYSTAEETPNEVRAREAASDEASTAFTEAAEAVIEHGAATLTGMLAKVALFNRHNEVTARRPDGTMSWDHQFESTVSQGLALSIMDDLEAMA